MADTKLADLTALTTPSGDDLLYVVDDPAGTPSDKKLAMDNLFTRGTVTVSSPVIDAAQTWNAGGVTFTGLKFNATDTASAAASLLMDLQVDGASRFNVGKGGALTFSGNLQVANNGVYIEGTAVGTVRVPGAGGYYGFTSSSSSTSSSTIDTFISRRGAANLRFGAADAAAPVAQTLSVQSVVAGTTDIAGANLTITGSQGTGTGAGGSIIFQVAPAGSSGTAVNTPVIFGEMTSTRRLSLYNTFTDATTFERANIFWDSNVLKIGTEKGSVGGTARALEFQTDGVTRLTIAAAAGTITGAVFKATAYFDAPAGALNSSGGIYFGVTGTGAQIQATAVGVLALANYAATDFDRLQFGGTTSSFPALKRSTTFLQARLADDSAFAGFAAANVQAATAYTVATLPTPATGMIARVTDATLPVIGATVAGGGAAYALVNYNGANWTVIGV
jgi:hypothetical protein